MLVQNMATLAISTMAQFTMGHYGTVPQCKQPKQPYFIQAYYRKLTQNQNSFRIAIVCLYKIWLVWLLLWWLLWKKNIEKKSKKLKFYETSKNHIFRKSIFFIFHPPLKACIEKIRIQPVDFFPCLGGLMSPQEDLLTTDLAEKVITMAKTDPW